MVGQVANFGGAIKSESNAVPGTVVLRDEDGNSAFNAVTAGQLIVNGAVFANVRLVITTYAVANDDYTILCDTTTGTFPITLPSASANKGRIIRIKLVRSSTALVITPTGSDKTDSNATGGATLTISTINQSITFQSDGISTWEQIGH